MGIKKINSFLQQLNLIYEFKNLNDVKKYINNNKKEYFFVTIDTSIYIYKYLRAETKNNDDFISLFRKQINKLIKNKIIPIYIFDGCYDRLKSDTICKRTISKNNASNMLNDLSSIDINTLSYNERKEYESHLMKLKLKSINISNTILDKLKNLFDSLNIPYIISVQEADVICAKLVKCGYANACLSEDMDILISSCNYLIKSHCNQYYVYNYYDILKKLDITAEQFCKFAVLLGSDYSRSANNKISSNELFQLCKKYNFNINNILDNIININIHRKYFINESSSFVLSLTELSDSVYSNNINDSKIMIMIYHYYNMAFNLLNFYNYLDDDIIQMSEFHNIEKDIKLNDEQFIKLIIAKNEIN